MMTERRQDPRSTDRYPGPPFARGSRPPREVTPRPLAPRGRTPWRSAPRWSLNARRSTSRSFQASPIIHLTPAHPPLEGVGSASCVAAGSVFTFLGKGGNASKHAYRLTLAPAGGGKSVARFGDGTALQLPAVFVFQLGEVMVIKREENSRWLVDTGAPLVTAPADAIPFNATPRPDQ